MKLACLPAFLTSSSSNGNHGRMSREEEAEVGTLKRKQIPKEWRNEGARNLVGKSVSRESFYDHIICNLSVNEGEGTRCEGAGRGGEGKEGSRRGWSSREKNNFRGRIFFSNVLYKNNKNTSYLYFIFLTFHQTPGLVVIFRIFLFFY